MQDDEYSLLVWRYVERNALRAGLVQRAEDWSLGSLARWLEKPERDPQLLSAWPVARSPRWVEHVNNPLTTENRSQQRPSGRAAWR